MKYTSHLMILLVIGPLGTSSGFSQDRAPRKLRGWGQIVDPERDCQFRVDANRLTITIPGTKHDLSVEAGDLNAPRVLRDVEGDFIAQVKVSGNVKHSGAGTSRAYLPYHGLGLLVWQDERNYLRFERAALGRGGGGTHYATLQLRKDGRLANPQEGEIPDQDLYLRLERRGSRILGALSPDGVRWRYLAPITVAFPQRIKVGVDAINTSSERFSPVFSELEVFRKEKETD